MFHCLSDVYTFIINVHIPKCFVYIITFYQYCIPVSIMEIFAVFSFLYNFVQHLFLSWIENGRDD